MFIKHIGAVGVALGLGLGLGAGVAVAEPSAHAVHGAEAATAKRGTAHATSDLDKGTAHSAPRPVATSHPVLVNRDDLIRAGEVAGALGDLSVDQLSMLVVLTRVNGLSAQVRAMVAAIETKNVRLAALTARLANPELTQAERGTIETQIAHLNSRIQADQTRLNDISTMIANGHETLAAMKADALRQRQIIRDAIG
ncbi:hypothetical protein ACXDF8_00965 [Mycolicibacterium sp. CBM1]